MSSSAATALATAIGCRSATVKSITRLDLVAGERALGSWDRPRTRRFGYSLPYTHPRWAWICWSWPRTSMRPTPACRATANPRTAGHERLRLVVPVSDPDRWTAAAPIFVRMLNFLTGIAGRSGFAHDRARFARIAPTPPGKLIGPPFDDLALFSGGLDSLIGAIDALEAGRTPLLISHAGEGATSDAQTTIFDALEGAVSGRSLPAPAPLDGLPGRLRPWIGRREDHARPVLPVFRLGRVRRQRARRAVHAEGPREWTDRGQRAARSPSSRRTEHAHHPSFLYRPLERCARRARHRRPDRESLLGQDEGRDGGGLRKRRCC